MEQIWIIGAGRFGKIGAQRLAAGHPHCCITVVDSHPDRLNLFKDTDCRRIESDGAAFLADGLEETGPPDWIVPAVPVHLAWEWCRLKTETDALVPVTLPETFDAHLPNPMRGNRFDFYTSAADFLCPDNCSEPEGYCTVTGEPRIPAMFDRIKALRFESYVPLVVQSQQLAPGVGGYRPADLFALLERITQEVGPFLIATSCRCHGVLTAVVKQPGQST